MQRIGTIVALALVGACSAPAPTPSSTAPASPAVAPAPAAPNYVGRWIGVEGMVLDVAAGDRPGRYRLTMQYDLDHRQVADATLDGEALMFERDGARKTLRPTGGRATGLKYLAGKKDCLTVAPGEGYCRDSAAWRSRSATRLARSFAGSSPARAVRAR